MRNSVIIEAEGPLVILKVPHRGIEVTSPTVERALDAAARIMQADRSLAGRDHLIEKLLRDET